jgi:hypothetical protein
MIPMMRFAAYFMFPLLAAIELCRAQVTMFQRKVCFCFIGKYLFPLWVWGTEKISYNIVPMREIHFSDHHARTNELFIRVKRV